MNKDVFIKIIQKLQDFEHFIDRIDKYIIIEQFDELFIPATLVDLFFESVFNSETLDKINYWLWEEANLNASYEEISDFYDELFGSMAK